MAQPTLPRRILYVINSLGSGGAERQLMYLISGLDRTQYEPIVLTLYDESEAIPYFFQRELENIGVEVFSLGLLREANPALRFVNAVRKYIRFYRKHKPAIVQGCLHFPNLLARAGRSFLPRHILITMAQEDRYTPTRLRIERLSSTLCDVIVANSARSMKRLIEDGQVPANKVRYINCGVEYEQFQKNTNPELRATQFPNAKFLAGVIARIAPNKDHPTLLKALNILKQSDRLPDDFRLLIIGGVSHQAAQVKIDELLRDYDLHNYVIQLPPTKNIAPIYHAIDISIQPSSAESFGLVVVEAFAAGKPVIASDEANVLGIVKDGATGWTFPTADANILAEKLHNAIHLSKTELIRLGENAAQQVPQFAVYLMVESYGDLYEEFINR